MSQRAAKIVLDLVIKQIAEQNEILKAVEGQCTPEEFAEYKRGVAESMGTMIFDIMNPIVARYPELEPTDESWMAAVKKRG
jgi:hypothetical protein